ncbi:MAG TPA: tetratricopeptide repeat protein [Stellaceae bacterium]|nr:tetratricopeptide repeat protein [Stellaceae bacterium]
MIDRDKWSNRLAGWRRRFAGAPPSEARLRDILAREPDRIDTLKELGRQLLRERRFGEAAEIWSRVVAGAPPAAGPAFQFARALHRNGQWDAAAEQYFVVLSLAPRHEKAFQALEQISRRAVHSPAAGAALAASIMQRLRALDNGAERAAETAAAVAGKIAQFAAASLTKAPEAALSQFNLALLIAPGLPDALQGAAMCAERLGKSEQALALWQQLALARPDSVEAGLQADRLRSATDRPATDAPAVAARIEAPRAAVSDAKAAGLLLKRMRAAYSDGRDDAVEAIAAGILRADPLERTALLLLSRSYLRRQLWEKAAATLVTLASVEPEPFGAKLNLARALAHIPHAEAAARLYEDLARTQPDNREILTALARHYMTADPERSFGLWSRLAALDSGNVEPLLQMARLRVRQERAAEAKPLFAAIIEIDPGHLEALTGLGRILAEEDGDAAPQFFRDWAERRPNDPTPLLDLARLFQKRRDRDRAAAVYRQILDRHSGNVAAMTRLAQLLGNERNRIAEALDLWRRVAEMDPASAAPLLQRGALLERIGRAGEAESDYRAALLRAPRDVGALIALAKRLSGAGRWNEAIENFDAAHRLDPKRPDALLGMGRCFQQLGRLEDALSAYDKVLAVDPANVNALLYRGRMLWQDFGRPDEAIAQWRTACATDPANTLFWNELVFTLAKADRESEALAALDAAEQALPATSASWIALARTAEASLFNERAVAYLHRAIAAEPNDASHRAALGFYHARQGMLRGALRHLLDSRDMNPVDIPVAKQLVETVHTLNRLGIDHIAAAQDPDTQNEILIPERLFDLVRRIAETDIPRYVPVERRVILATASLAPGGAERQLANLARDLNDPVHRLDIAVFCVSTATRTRRDFFLPLLADSSVDVVVPDRDAAARAFAEPAVAPYASIIRQFPRDMAGPIAFWLAEFARRRPQVVHAWQDSTNLIAVVAALLAGVPRIVLCTRSVRPDNPRRRLKRFMHDAYRAVLDHPSVVLSNNSRAGAADYAAWLGRDPASIEIVHNGIDFDMLERNADPIEARRIRDALNIPANASVLGSVFRMSEEKRPLLWVETAAALAKRDPRAHFIVCGDGPMRHDMAELAAASGLRDRLHLPGQQTPIAPWYLAMDAVLLTSRHEGLPNVLLEAQCLGRPVVAPDVGGMSDAVLHGVTGWIVPDADAATLAERVAFCLGNSDWAANAREKARAFVTENFSMAASLRRNMDVYRIPMAAP